MVAPICSLGGRRLRLLPSVSRSRCGQSGGEPKARATGPWQARPPVCYCDALNLTRWVSANHQDWPRTIFRYIWNRIATQARANQLNFSEWPENVSTYPRQSSRGASRKPCAKPESTSATRRWSALCAKSPSRPPSLRNPIARSDRTRLVWGWTQQEQLMSQNQWWVALGLAGMIVLMQLYDRAKPAYDSWKSAPAQAKKK